jgi:undecaprenyl-diphosphatase
MNLGQALILSLVEGITEFLPISSTGHMILAARLMNIMQSDFVKSFEIFIQLGAILAVVIIYLKRILTRKKETMKIAAAFIPTAVIGLILYKIIKNYLLGNAWITALALLAGGIFILLFEKKFTENANQKNIEDLSWGEAALIGVFQAIAVIPGVSRSLMTIIGGLRMGLSKKEAVEMSFILAIPTMAAASGLDLVKSGWSFTGQEWLLMASGFIGAFISAWLVVKWLLNYVQKHNFQIFGYYRIAVGLLWFVLIR